jgi:hypothetical protein
VTSYDDVRPPGGEKLNSLECSPCRAKLTTTETVQQDREEEEKKKKKRRSWYEGQPQ